jgi:quercetin dioxygenase-like cupin family protein
VSGGSTGTVKFKSVTNYHYHTYDERVVVIKGTVSHYTDALPESGKKSLGLGSYWYQAAGVVHQDKCLSNECILFVVTDKSGETKEATPNKK